VDGFLLAFSLGITGRLQGHLMGDWAACALLVFAGAGIGLAISALCASTQTAMTILPLALIPQVMLSGFVFPVAFVPDEEAVVMVRSAGPGGAAHGTSGQAVRRLHESHVPAIERTGAAGRVALGCGGPVGAAHHGASRGPPE
jgi:hypothetical protein